MVFRFKPKLSKINFGKLDPKKALITVLYIKLMVSYLDISKITTVLEGPSSIIDVDINIKEN
tara:strand:- start:272 stop:457 length:186 start_codon:yes stop_codon:yes gene_type:complete